MAGREKKKASLKPFTFQLTQSSLSLLSHILPIYNPTFLEKGELCVANRASPTRLYTSVYTYPTQRIAAHLHTAYHFEFHALYDLTYPPIGLTTIEALHTSHQIIYLSTTIC